MQRKLGNIETLMTMVHEKFNGTTQGMPVISLSGNIDFSALKNAACLLFDKYVMLRYRIQHINEQFNQAQDLSKLDQLLEGEKDSCSFNQGIGISNLGEIGLTLKHRHFTVFDYLPLTNRIAGNHAVAVHVWEFNSELQYLFMFTSPLVTEERVSNAVSDFSASLQNWVETSSKESLEMAL